MAMFDLLKMLSDAKVEFVLVGGLAVALHGYQRLTMDVDVVLAMDDENLQRFIACAKSVGLQPINPVDIVSLANPSLLDQWHHEKNMLAFSLRSSEAVATVLDVLIRPIVSFAALKKDASLIEIGSLSIAVASIEHLIAMKSCTGRSKDQLDIEELRKIQEKTNP